MKLGAPVAMALVLISACAAYTSPDDPGRGSSSGSEAAGRAGAGQTLAPVGGGGPAAGGASGRASTGGDPGRDSSEAGAAGDAAEAPGMPTGGKPASSGGTAGASATGGSGGAVSACGTPAVASGATPLIDDFEHLGRAVPANEARSGVWDVWTKSATASMFPPSANYRPAVRRRVGYTSWTGQSIGGTDDWGPTPTVQLAGGCPYDASVYSGISLRLKGSAVKQSGAASSPLPLKVMVWQPQGVPSKDAKGGTCTAPACYNHYSTFVTVPADWETPVNVPFASLTQGEWTGTLPFAWNPQQLVAIQFQVEVDGSKGELTTFDLSIDDLGFVP